MAKIAIFNLDRTDKLIALSVDRSSKLKGGSDPDPRLPFYDDTQRFPYKNPRLKDL